MEKDKVERVEFGSSSEDIKIAEAGIVVDGPPEILPEQEKKILRKLDWHLLPVTTMLFLLSFIDRYGIYLSFLKAIPLIWNWGSQVKYWKCKACRPGERPQHAWNAVQHGSYHLLLFVSRP